MQVEPPQIQLCYYNIHSLLFFFFRKVNDFLIGMINYFLSNLVLEGGIFGGVLRHLSTRLDKRYLTALAFLMKWGALPTYLIDLGRLINASDSILPLNKNDHQITNSKIDQVPKIQISWKSGNLPRIESLAGITEGHVSTTSRQSERRCLGVWSPWQ